MNSSIQRDCIGMFKKIFGKSLTVHPITTGSHPPFASAINTNIMKGPDNTLQQPI